MANPQVRIFPHSKKQFPLVDHLSTWLLNGLRDRGGVYHLVAKGAVAELPPGSIVLFRYGQEIVGEAVVREGKKLLDKKLKETTLSGEKVEYEAKVTFAPSSIRLYDPPLPVAQIQIHTEKNIVSSARVYVKLDWNIYTSVLKEVVSFIS